jgi:hypothetical protein
MKAKFKVNDEFRLKKDGNFTRAFPRSRNPDGSVGEIDLARVRAGEMAKIYKIDESAVERVEPRYELEFQGRDKELKVRLRETEILDLFEPLARH